MIVDSLLSAQKLITPLWDFCIIGSGFAGMALAWELTAKNSNYRIALIESGEYRPRAEIQGLSDLANHPANHAPMRLAVNRRIGGASGVWGGRCVPYDEYDFLKRDYVPDAEWPISYAELFQYLDRACAFLKCGRGDFTVASGLRQISEYWRDGDVLASTIERWSLPLDLRREFYHDLRLSRSIFLFSGLTCVNLSYDLEAGTVRHAVLSRIDGEKLSIRARRFIIAAGGLESARLLLYSNRKNEYTAGDFGRALGRFYQGHISGKIANVVFSGDARQTIYQFEKDQDGVYFRRRLTFPARVLSQHRLLNFAAWLDNPPIFSPEHGNGVLSAAYLALLTPGIGAKLASPAIRTAILDNASHHPALAGHLRNVSFNLPATLAFCLRFVFQRYCQARKLPGFFAPGRNNVYALHYHAEQAPSWQSFARLSAETDRLGVNRLEVHLRYSDQDMDSVVRGHGLLDHWLRGNGIGRLAYHAKDLPAQVARQAADGFHQIGVTRMAADRNRGVVDADCKVFGLSNLYMCGSGVFPTSGQANPTLTIVCLALRLADHLHANNV